MNKINFNTNQFTGITLVRYSNLETMKYNNDCLIIILFIFINYKTLYLYRIRASAFPLVTDKNLK